MAKKKDVTTIVIDKQSAKLIAVISSIISSAVLARLFERGIINDDDLETVFAHVEGGAMGDKSHEAIAKIIADTLRGQVKTILLN